MVFLILPIFLFMIKLPPPPPPTPNPTHSPHLPLSDPLLHIFFLSLCVFCVSLWMDGTCRYKFITVTQWKLQLYSVYCFKNIWFLKNVCWLIIFLLTQTGYLRPSRELLEYYRKKIAEYDDEHDELVSKLEEYKVTYEEQVTVKFCDFACIIQ